MRTMYYPDGRFRPLKGARLGGQPLEAQHPTVSDLEVGARATRELIVENCNPAIGRHVIAHRVKTALAGR